MVCFRLLDTLYGTEACSYTHMNKFPDQEQTLFALKKWEAINIYLSVEPF